MNSTVWIKAAITFFIALGGTLITLFSGQGVQTFADVTPVQYAVAVIGAFLAGLAVVQAQLSDSPANIRQTNDIVEAAANLDKQAGLFTPNFAGFVLILATLGAFGMTLAGCQTVPETPRQVLLSAYSAADFATTSIAQAKVEGRITAEQRDVYINDVQRARDLLHEARVLLANEPAPGSTNDSQATAKLRFAQEILISIQAALAKEQNP
jgi:hypothetical protein